MFNLPARLRSKVRRLNDELLSDTWILSGREKSGGANFSFSYSGNEARKEYVRNLAFAEGGKEKYLGKCLRRLVPLIVRMRFPGCDMSVFEVSESNAQRSARMASLVNPVSMLMEIDINGSLESSMRKKRFKSISTRISDNHLSCEVRTDDASFDDFYFNMYVAHSRARHGNRAVLSDYEGLKSAFHRGELVMIKHDGKDVGGSLIDFGRGRPRLLEMGLRDGSEAYLKMGVSDATYYFSFARILERRGEGAVLGTSRGFLKDGPLTYKLSLGAHFSDRHYVRDGVLHFRFLRPSDGLVDFLAANPMITMDGDGGYFATVFSKRCDSITEKVKETFVECCQRNLRPRLYVFEDQAAVHMAIPDLQARIGPCEILSGNLLFR